MGDIKKKYLYMKKKFIGSEILSNSSLYSPPSENVLNYIKKSYYDKQFTNRGPLVNELEEKLLDFHDTKYCITFCSAFWALVAAIKNLAIKNKKYILMPSLTFKGLDEAALWAGFTPLYCDIHPSTLGLDINSLDQNNLNDIALILAVHPSVDSLNAHMISQFASSVSIPIVFYSVESVNETLPQGKVGIFGNCEIFSLNACSLINGLEGGYITTNDSILYDQLKKFQNFSLDSKGQLTNKFSMNAKLNEGHAAFALASLDDLELLVNHNFFIYKEYLSSVKLMSDKLSIRLYNNKIDPSYNKIVAELDKKYIDCREKLIITLKSLNIHSTMIDFFPLHESKQGIIGTKNLELENTDLYSKNLFSLPSGWPINKDQISPIIHLINTIIDDIFAENNAL